MPHAPRLHLRLFVALGAMAFASNALGQTAASLAGRYHGHGIPGPEGQPATTPAPVADVVIVAAAGGGYTITMTSPSVGGSCALPLVADATGLAFVAGSSCQVGGGATLTATSGHVTATGANVAINARLRYTAGATNVPLVYEFHGAK